MQNELKPINTIFSVDSVLNIKELTDAKILMNEKYGNKYSHIPAHLAYVIMPFPETNLKRGIGELTKYIEIQKPFEVHISDLKYEEKDQFFYIEILGEEIREHHKNIISILNKYRDGCIREKDLLRLSNGDFDEKSSKYLADFGSTRVFDNFKTHVTIGNVTIENVDMTKLENELFSILSPILNKKVLIDNIHGVFLTDSAKNQSEMKELWDKVFILK